MPKMTPEEFVTWLGPAAQVQCKPYNLPASVVIAQGAVESGWGASTIGKFNLFGRKAVSGDKCIQAWTREYGDENSYVADDSHIYQGDGWWRILDDFKDYDSLLQAIDDWCILITQEPRYADAWSVWCNTGDIVEFAQAMASAYATNPEYADNVLVTIRANDLTQFDA